MRNSDVIHATVARWPMRRLSCAGFNRSHDGRTTMKNARSQKKAKEPKQTANSKDAPTLAPMYTVRQVAAHLGLQIAAVLKLIRANAIVAIDVSKQPGGKPRWRISSDALAAFKNARTTRPEPVTVRSRRRYKAREDDYIEFFP